jgi:hypothetical protein
MQHKHNVIGFLSYKLTNCMLAPCYVLLLGLTVPATKYIFITSTTVYVPSSELNWDAPSPFSP